MHQRCEAICYIGAPFIHVPCMQLSLETLTFFSIGATREYLLVLDLNVLYTPHTWTLP